MQNHLKIVIISDIFYHQHTCCIIFRQYLASYFVYFCQYMRVNSLTFQILSKYNFELFGKLYGFRYLNNQHHAVLPVSGLFSVLLSRICKAQALCQSLSPCLDGDGFCIHVLAEGVCHCLKNPFLIFRRELT